MAASSIKNPSVEICAMPAPFQGVLKGGQTVILSYTPAQLETMCPSLSDAFIVTDLGSYSGATDDADFGPITDEATTFEAPVTIAPAAVSSAGQVALTVTGAADTGITASTERSDVYLNLARTETWATGALATQRAIRIAAPTYAFVGASTITNAVTVDISGAPAAGANATITNAYALRVASGTSYFGGYTLVSPAAAASGVRSALGVVGAADTGVTASTEQVDVNLNLARTVTWAAGALATQRAVRVQAPTYAFDGASVITNAVTFDISGAPVAGANATLTNSYAFRVASGTSYFAGLTIVQPAVAAGVVRSCLLVTGAADTAVTASTEQVDVNLNLARTVTWAAGAIADQRAVRIQAPTYAFDGASVITTAATLSISGAPVAGANATITNAYALHVAGGRAQFAGLLAAGAGLSITGQITAETVDASGTPGAAVINAPTGTVAIAIGADNVVVTNNLVTANSIVIPVLQFVDATLTQILSCVPGPGSFTITGNAVATAATRISFIVIN